MNPNLRDEIIALCYKAVLLAFVAAALMGLITALANLGNAQPLMPVYVGVKTYSCTAVEATDFAGTAWWHVTTDIVYFDGQDVKKMYAMRPAQDANKAVNDCRNWMSYVRKQLAKVQREKKVPPKATGTKLPPHLSAGVSK